MAEALVFGLIASSGLVLGSLAGTRFKMPERALAFMLAFASGALITALAFELFEDAYEKSGAWIAGVAFAAGAAVFVAVSSWLDRRVEQEPGPDPPKVDKDVATPDPIPPASRSAGAGFALLAAVTLDGVPENLALGVSLLDGASLALLVAIFFSNLPESLVGAVAMRAGGQHMRSVVGTWFACALLLAAAVVVGRVLAEPMSDEVLAVALGFAGGAVLASLADTLMPEAFERGRPFNAFATAAGFFLSFVLAG